MVTHASSGRLRAWLLLTPLILAVTTYGLLNLAAPLSEQNGVYLYAGQRFLEGLAPYVSAFDGSGPLTPIAVALGLLIAKAIGFGVYTVNGFFLVLNCVLVATIYFLLRRLFASERAAFLGTLTFVALWAFPPQTGTHRWAETLVLLFETCCLILAGRHRWLAAGVFGGLAALTWPCAGLLGLAVLIVAGLQPSGIRAKAVTRTLVGAALPLAATGLYFLFEGAVGQAFESVVLFNLFHAEGHSLSLAATLSYVASSYGPMLFPLWIGLLLVPGFGAERRRGHSSWRRFVADDPLAPAVLGWLLLLIWAAMPFGPHPNLTPLLPLVVIGSTWILERALIVSGQTVQGGSRVRALIAGGVLLAMSLTALGGVFHRPGYGMRWQQTTAIAIERRLNKGDAVLSIGAPDILALMRRSSPSRYLRLDDGVQSFIDATHDGFSKWVAGLEALDPAAILWRDTRGAHVPTLFRWIVSRYDAEKVGPVTAFFRRPPSPAPAHSALSSIVLITIDTLRADHLGCYGYFRGTSPSIDALAGDSIVFEHCVAPMGTTLPSHTSLLTGTYPEEHGVLANVGTGGEKFIAHANLQTFAQIARDRGYRTAAFVSASPLKKNNGIAAGFQTFVEPPSAAALLAQQTILDAVGWLNRNSDGPFFLWVHVWDAHSPHEAPVPYDTLYRTDAALKASLADRGVGGSVRQRIAAGLTNAYDGEIRYVDDWVGVLLSRLSQADLRDRTAVVLTADHGEALGQDGEWEHGCVHESQLHVPLILRVPGQPPRRVPHTVSLVDAFPTLLGLLGQSWPDFLEQSSGVDVLADGFTPRPVFSQRETVELSDLHLHKFSYVLSTDPWKLVHQPEGRDYVYHLSTDPHELEDRSASEPDTVAALKQKLLAELARQRARGDAFRGEKPAEPQQVDPDQLEALRSLGYVN